MDTYTRTRLRIVTFQKTGTFTDTALESCCVYCFGVQWNIIYSMVGCTCGFIWKNRKCMDLSLKALALKTQH